MNHKIGDIVEIVANKLGHMFEIGEHVRIIDVDCDGNVDEAESLDGTESWFLDESEIKDLEEN